MARVKRTSPPRSKRRVARLTPSLTMGPSLSSWLFSAMRPASSVVTPAHCIWPSLLERPPSPSLARRILRVTAPIAQPALLALGAGIATCTFISGLMLMIYFAVFYSIVMQREVNELCLRHGASYEEYARSVSLFIPRLTAAKLSGVSAGSFSIVQYKKNHEWQAAVGFLFLLLVLLAIWRLR